MKSGDLLTLVRVEETENRKPSFPAHENVTGVHRAGPIGTPD